MRSLKENFEKLKLLLSKINFSFKVICLTETWCEDERFEKSSMYQLNDKVVSCVVIFTTQLFINKELISAIVTKPLKHCL